MRVLADLNHPRCKVTLLAWNGKYLLKLESGALEQTFKVDELDFTEAEVKALIDDEAFMNEALARFDAMHGSLGQALQRL